MDQRRERFDVVGLERLHVAREQLAVFVAQLRPGLGADVGRVERRSGALERTVHGRDAGPEQVSDLGRLPAEHLAEDQHGALARRQMLQSGDEGEPDRLVRDGDVGRVPFGCQRVLRNRFDPGHLGQCVEVRRDRLARGPEIHRPGAALAGVQHVEADVCRDPVEPRAQRRAALEAVQAPPGAQQRLLHGVLGLER